MEPVKLSRADWLHCKREILLAATVLVIGLALAGGSYQFHQTADQSRRQADAGLQAAQNSLASMEKERAELVESLPLYQALVDRSIIGREQRLNWHETLKAEQRRQAIGKISFSLSPRQPFNTDTAGDGAAEGLFKRYRSTMKLSLEFQKETTFVDFLERTADLAQALPILRGCQISRLGEPGQPDAGTLVADCIVDWATIQRKTPAGGPGAS